MSLGYCLSFGCGVTRSIEQRIGCLPTKASNIIVCRKQHGLILLKLLQAGTNKKPAAWAHQCGLRVGVVAAFRTLRLILPHKPVLAMPLLAMNVPPWSTAAKAKQATPFKKGFTSWHCLALLQSERRDFWKQKSSPTLRFLETLDYTDWAPIHSINKHPAGLVPLEMFTWTMSKTSILAGIKGFSFRFTGTQWTSVKPLNVKNWLHAYSNPHKLWARHVYIPHKSNGHPARMVAIYIRSNLPVGFAIEGLVDHRVAIMPGVSGLQETGKSLQIDWRHLKSL